MAGSSTKRVGPFTNVEQVLITQFVAEHPRITATEVTHLARKLQRRPRSIRKAIARAKRLFYGSAEEWVRLYQKGIDDAIAAGPDSKGFPGALRSLQWLLVNLRDGNACVVNTPENESGGGVEIFAVGREMPMANGSQRRRLTSSESTPDESPNRHV